MKSALAVHVERTGRRVLVHVRQSSGDGARVGEFDLDALGARALAALLDRAALAPSNDDDPGWSAELKGEFR